MCVLIVFQNNFVQLFESKYRLFYCSSVESNAVFAFDTVKYVDLNSLYIK